ncbi:membrane protease YdiL (CAAX protease family) [Thermocatellispora tengchongensis]|uniref:Membrane protease YdiL (CAAX protease family) n=1 Tax=Thermocatellispora tengchongensis TaxID=1073253 RepID=A0A840NTE0_9ACTN|nr:CPBP family intramembrane glutamic endopeptidase [Thermocatellispora tengchongensis]MBB5130848.1 membrane protease YdiL (CAAX protease family) [Thermocatellispora tengchongensis]
MTSPPNTPQPTTPRPITPTTPAPTTPTTPPSTTPPLTTPPSTTPPPTTPPLTTSSAVTPPPTAPPPVTPITPSPPPTTSQATTPQATTPQATTPPPTAPPPAATPASRRRARINFAVWAVIAAGAGWPLMTFGDASSAQGLWILLPALTALALHYLHRDGAGPLGLTLRIAHPVRWFAFATVLYPAAAVVTTAAAVLTTAASFSAAPAPGEPPLLAAIATAIPALLLKNLLEEFIFRGYGTRTALALGVPRLAAHALVGLVWMLWHIPLYLAWTPEADLRASTTLPWPWLLVGIVPLAALFGELRIRTGSIWPGIVLHTISNAVSAPLLFNGHLHYTGHSDALLGITPASAACMLIFGAAAYALSPRK